MIGWLSLGLAKITAQDEEGGKLDAQLLCQYKAVTRKLFTSNCLQSFNSPVSVMRYAVQLCKCFLNYQLENLNKSLFAFNSMFWFISGGVFDQVKFA